MASGIVASSAMSTITLKSHRNASVPSAASGLKLTRRGRFLLLGLPMMFLAIAALVLVGIVTSSAQASTQLAGTGASQITVQAGESIWSIAAANGHNRDPREVVAEIVQLNDLKSSVLQPGQQIFVPAS